MSDATQPAPQLAATPMPAVAPAPMPPPAAPSVESAPALPPIPNYAVRREMRSTSDGPAEHLIVTFGDPVRKITIKPLSLGDQWDLAEVTGNNAGNETWQNMAYTAATVTDFDGIPVPPSKQSRYDRSNLRSILNRLGIDGLRAASRALGGVTASADQAPQAGQAAMLDTAKN